MEETGPPFSPLWEGSLGWASFVPWRRAAASWWVWPTCPHATRANRAVAAASAADRGRPVVLLVTVALPAGLGRAFGRICPPRKELVKIAHYLGKYIPERKPTPHHSPWSSHEGLSGHRHRVSPPPGDVAGRTQPGGLPLIGDGRPFARLAFLVGQVLPARRHPLSLRMSRR